MRIQRGRLMSAGPHEKDMHPTRVNWDRDRYRRRRGGYRNAVEVTRALGPAEIARGIEVGHIPARAANTARRRPGAR